MGVVYSVIMPGMDYREQLGDACASSILDEALTFVSDEVRIELTPRYLPRATKHVKLRFPRNHAASGLEPVTIYTKCNGLSLRYPLRHDDFPPRRAGPQYGASMGPNGAMGDRWSMTGRLRPFLAQITPSLG